MTSAATTIALDGEGPRYEQIRRALRGRIVDGRWPPGTKLPSEHELMDLFGAARMTVNKALHQLQRDGLVVRRRKAGTFVAVPPEEHAVMRIADLAGEIEAAGHTYGYRLIGRRTIRATRDLAAAIGGRPGDRVLALTALHLSDGAPSILEERWIRLAAVPEAETAAFDAAAPGPWLLAHIPWTEARHSVFAVNAGPRIAALLAVSPGDACLVVERTTWREREPVTFVRLFYRGDRHRLVGRFHPGGAT